MLDQDAIEKREALAYAAGYESCHRDHAAEVKRLTAERDALQMMEEAAATEMKRLTARVAELESGAAFVGEEYHPQEWEIYWEEFRGKLRLAEFGSGSLSEQCERIRYRYTGPTTAPIPSPLPTAGDEGKCGCCCGHGTMAGPGTMACPDCGGTGKHPAPAEPDSPAEEREGETSDGRSKCLTCDSPATRFWNHHLCQCDYCFAVIDLDDRKPEDFAEGPQRDRFIAMMPPRKPNCLDGVPAVLCEDTEDGSKGWAYGPIDCTGDVAVLWHEIDNGISTPSVSVLQPIHHDAHDAAAVELRGRIERGGNDAQ